MNAREAAFHDMVEEGLTISVFAQEKTILELTRTISIDDVEVEIKVRRKFVPVVINNKKPRLQVKANNHEKCYFNYCKF